MTEEPAAAWEGMTAPEWAAATGAPRVHLFATVGSTNDVARRLAAEGAPALTAVLAERQLAGRGRAGRAWRSPPGLGLWLSLVHRPAQAAVPTALPLVVGLAVAEALDPFAAPATVGIKWPNDLLVDGRKLGGVLCEGAWQGGAAPSVVVGVGLNLLHRSEDLPPELRGSAASLAIAAGREPARREVAVAVLRALVDALAEPAGLSPARLAALRERDSLRGREVVATEPTTGAELARGIAAGIAPDGALLLRSAGGAVRRVVSGTVRPLPGGGAADPEAHDLNQSIQNRTR